jgi:putative transposase
MHALAPRTPFLARAARYRADTQLIRKEAGRLLVQHAEFSCLRLGLPMQGVMNITKDRTMSNRHRLHVPGGTYYLFRTTDSRHPIFSRPEEYARFSQLLPIALASSDAKLLAYCWLPEALHFVIEIGDRPVALFMRDLMWRYSRSPWHRVAEERPWFRERYRATLVQAETYLEALIRHVHYLPVRAGLADAPHDYPYSSHSAYLCRRTGPPVRTRKLLGLMGCQGNDRAPYARAMAQAPPECFGAIFERGMSDTPGIVGDAQFLSRLSSLAVVRTQSRPDRFIEKLITRIAERHALSVDDICSNSRRRELVIARAQIVWLAMRWNLGTLTDVARHLHHSPSAMTRAVARYRSSRPDLFTRELLGPPRPPTVDWLGLRRAS